MTRSELLEVVYRFYARGLYWTADDYGTTEEFYQQKEATRRAVAAYPTWKAMLYRLGARYEVFNDSLFLSGRYRDRMYGSAYSANIGIPGRTLAFYVSFLGPYYGLYRTGVPSERPAARDLAREIETSFPGYEPIPPELGNEVVPDVVSLGETTIYQCLLSDRWGMLSWPWPSEIAPVDYPFVEEDKGPDPGARFGDGVYFKFVVPPDHEEAPDPEPDEPDPPPAIPLTAGERSGHKQGT